ncbi:MAG: class I SAM-dependent methyltransferase [Bacteroidota bacterium]
MPACIICNNTQDNKLFRVKELQLGIGDEFTYQLCGDCGSMQLTDPPADFSRYYPNEDYYSFNMELKQPEKPGLLRRLKASYILYGKNVLAGKLLSIGYKLPDFYEWMINTHVQPDDAILDVGCGNGSLLSKLYKIGFTHLTGIDPFLNKDHDLGPIKLLQKDIHALHQRFDLVMMHHSLEHMTEPLKALQKARELLNDDKYLLVRIPVMGNYGWHKYNTWWCGIDAPRHIFVPSEKAMHLLADKAGFIIDKLEYDSSDYVIWSSEQYMKGIPLHASNSRMISKKNNVFSEKEIENFKQIIAAENKKNNGDTAAFYLKKK